MKKMNWLNGMQRLLIVVCIMSVMTGIFVTKGNVAQADDKKTPMCSLQSVTLEIEGEEYTFDGEMGTFVVDKSTKWEEMFSKDSIKVVDYKVLANDECTHESGHDNLVIELDGLQLLEYVSDTTSYNNITDEQWEDMFIHCVDLTVYLDDGEAGQIKVHFAKEYNIAYDEKSLEGAMDVITGEAPSLPTTYVYGMNNGNLPILEKEGFTFGGWTWETETNFDTEASIRFITSWLPGGDATLTAQWTEEPRIDISGGTFDVSFNQEQMYSGEEITPGVEEVYYEDSETHDITYLWENEDYILLYKNNVEVASKEDDNPPTIIVKGVGAYKGEITCKFSIIKAELYEDYNNLSLVEGSALSEIDLNDVAEVKSSINDKTVAGTWEWNTPDKKVAQTDDDEYPSYQATFTPTDVDHYQVLVTYIYVRVGASIENWNISLADKGVLTYTGEAHKPKVTIMNGEVQMVEGEDYEISYVNNVDAGDKSHEKAPTVIVEGIGNYAGTKKIAFTIEKASPSVEAAPSASAIEEGKKLSDSILTGGEVVGVNGNALNGVFSWKDDTITPATTDSGATKYKVIFTPNDTDNYKVIETDVVITVNKKAEDPKEDPKEDTTKDSSTDDRVVVGDKVSDKSGKATYKVTKSEEGKMEVTYVAPTNKSKTVSVPATVTLEDGTKAKVTAVAAKAFKGNTKVQTVTIGKNVKTIGKEAFSGCKNLKKVKSATNVTSIGKNAFANCKNLNSVAMGSKVTAIGEKAFYKCTKLTKITIPKNVKSIGKSAFQDCKNLETIDIKTTKLTKKNVGKNAFKGIDSEATIDVPNSKVKAYKTILKAKGVGKKATIK
ncbi:MAG: leucine-rich repeat protein [Lachnospiraceae bacterium]|nr:leucine-rich repeat protein [Lachnospiraceae bacterium]